MAAIGGSIGLALIAFMIRWAFKYLNILPTCRMLLMFVVGCGLSFALGSVFLAVYGWFTDTGGSVLPGQVAGVLIALPLGAAAIATIFFVFFLKPGNRPDKLAENFALALPVLLLFVGGTYGAFAGDLRSNVKDTTGQMLSSFMANKGGSR